MTEDEGPLFVGATCTGEAWFAVAFDGEGFDHAAVFEAIGDVWARYEEVGERVLVDVPIGLLDGEGERPCDEHARAVLGPRSEAIVAPPVREATRKQTYRAATRANERVAGTELSEQAFARAPAIAAVDDLLQGVPESRDLIAEAHPEVCFRAFAGEPLQHPPTTAGGYAERMRTLADFDHDAPPTVQYAAEAAGDAPVRVASVLDAAAMAYTARPGPGDLRRLPPEPSLDERGLAMQLTYRAASALPAP